MTEQSEEQEPTLFRSMAAASDGLPATGSSARTLGARPTIDVPLQPGNRVYPGTGGMSVSPDDPHNLPRHRRPSEFGGIGRDPVWSVRPADLGPELRYRPDPLNPTEHGFVEPAQEMSFANYQSALEATRPAWRRWGV